MVYVHYILFYFSIFLSHFFNLQIWNFTHLQWRKSLTLHQRSSPPSPFSLPTSHFSSLPSISIRYPLLIVVHSQPLRPPLVLPRWIMAPPNQNHHHRDERVCKLKFYLITKKTNTLQLNKTIIILNYLAEGGHL